MDEIEKVIAGLTEAQRGILLAERLPDVVSFGDLKAIRAAELTDRAVSRKTGWKVPLTPLGLAVRARLQERSNA